MQNQKLLKIAAESQGELLTIEEMAARLKVKKSWLYFRSMQTGDNAIPRVKVGKYLRFIPADVMAWVAKQYGECD